MVAALPLCDVDFMPTVATVADSYPATAFTCSNQNCSRHYHQAAGYFDYEGSGQAGVITHLLCEADAYPMFLEAVGRTGMKLWICPHCGCGIME